MGEKMLTTQEAAELLEVSTGRVVQLASRGQLPGAEKFGRDWSIPVSAVILYQKTRKPGRPKREAT